MNDIRQNPFRDRGLWWWRDDRQIAHGPYPSQLDALRNLMRYLDNRTGWQKLIDLFRELLCA